MRNFGQRVNRNNVFGIQSGCDESDLETCQAILLQRMCTESIERCTPSEASVIEAFTAWFWDVSRNGYKAKNGAYIYANLNDGLNVVFIHSEPYEGTYCCSIYEPARIVQAVQFE